jgi:hypothetical protein
VLRGIRASAGGTDAEVDADRLDLRGGEEEYEDV